MLKLIGIIITIIANGSINPNDCIKLEAIFVGTKPVIIVKQTCEHTSREIKLNLIK